MIDSLFDLSGRVAVVTGGLGRLGSVYVDGLTERGMKVAVFDVATRETAPGAHRVDVTDRASIEAATGRVLAEWGVPHVLVNNAALDSPPDAPPEEVGPFETYPEASFDRVMDVNVKGTLLCCQVIGAAMAGEGRGSIVNISSIYGVLSPDQGLYQYRRDRGEEFYKPVGYSVTKSALINLTRYLAVYWGKAGVRVNTLTFAGVYANQEPAFLEPYTRKVPLGRMAEPEDYDGPVVFLMSDAARYMTGANVVVDGGFTAM